MNLQNINKWNLLEYPATADSENKKRIRDAVPEMAEHPICTDSVDFSKEGMAALREQVQSMSGHIDVEEIRRMKEILPKLKMNPSNDFLWAMQHDMQNSLNAIKEKKGSYTLDDLISIRMEAYTRQYDDLQKSYADGSRDIYVSDRIDENGKLQYHKVTQKEDLEYLNGAFDRITDSMVFSATSREIQWQMDEKFGGKPPLSVSLPKGYGERLGNTLKRAAFEYVEQREKGQNVNASALALKYLNEDIEFSNAMRILFS